MAYTDFFGDEIGVDPLAAPSVGQGQYTPEQQQRMREQEQARLAAEAQRRRDQATATQGQAMSKLLAPGGPLKTTVSPGQWGQFNYGVQGRPGNYSMDIPSNPLTDAAQIGGYLGTLGPARDVAAQYGGGPLAPLALLGPIGAAGIATDLVSPGRGGAPTLPTSLQTPAYGGSRGVTGGNTPAAGASGSDMPVAVDTFGTPIQRPGQYQQDAPVAQPRSQAAPIARPAQYQSDQAMSQLNSLFASEQNQGPSQAEALLQKATDRAASQALGIAAGARGGAGARARARQQAVAANAAMGSQASSDIAALRAREENDRRARQAQIMGMISNTAQGIDARDLGYVQTEAQRQQAADQLTLNYLQEEQRRRNALDQLNLGYTQTESQAAQAAASLANTAYQQNADREMRRNEFNAQQPVGFMEDPLGSVFTRLFGGPLRSAPRI